MGRFKTLVEREAKKAQKKAQSKYSEKKDTQYVEKKGFRPTKTIVNKTQHIRQKV